MGLLNQISDAFGGLGGGRSGGAHHQQLLIQLGLQLVQQNGGLRGVLQKFQEQGLGGLIGSWLGTGANLGFKAEQVREVFGGEQLQNMARQNGMTEPDLANGLAAVIPQLVDRLTPDGQAGTGDELLKQGMSVLGGFLR